jgi:hypothetical protein
MFSKINITFSYKVCFERTTIQIIQKKHIQPNILAKIKVGQLPCLASFTPAGIVPPRRRCNRQLLRSPFLTVFHPPRHVPTVHAGHHKPTTTLTMHFPRSRKDRARACDRAVVRTTPRAAGSTELNRSSHRSFRPLLQERTH